MVIIGLGSNIENRLEYLETAIHYLNRSALNITLLSPIYESAALLKPGSPQKWNIKFLNMVVIGTTKLSPHELLLETKSIEKKIGRKDRGLWAPREIDIDILMYDDLKIAEDNLTLPHPGMLEREFVLFPLADIVPDLLLEIPDTLYHHILQEKDNILTVQQITKIFPQSPGTVKTSLKIKKRDRFPPPPLAGEG